MDEALLKRSAFSRLRDYARSYYELLGNRRKFQRAPMTGAILVTAKGSVIDSTYEFSCVDISPRGIGVEGVEALTLNAFVQIHSGEDGPRRLARVRYCVPRDGRYRVGLEFIEDPAAHQVP